MKKKFNLKRKVKRITGKIKFKPAKRCKKHKKKFRPVKAVKKFCKKNINIKKNKKVEAEA